LQIYVFEKPNNTLFGDQNRKYDESISSMKRAFCRKTKQR